MSTLNVDRKGVSVRLDANTLIFEESGARVGCVPLGPLERVILRGDVSLQASVLGRLGERGIGVLVLSGRRSEPTLLMHRPHNDARRRIRQWQRSQDPDFRLEVARDLLRRKLQSQRRLLAERAETDLEHRYELRTAAGRVAGAEGGIAAAAAVASLRGIEGAGSHAYFGGLQAIVPPPDRLFC